MCPHTRIHTWKTQVWTNTPKRPPILCTLHSHTRETLSFAICFKQNIIQLQPFIKDIDFFGSNHQWTCLTFTQAHITFMILVLLDRVEIWMISLLKLLQKNLKISTYFSYKLQLRYMFLFMRLDQLSLKPWKVYPVCV